MNSFLEEYLFDHGIEKTCEYVRLELRANYRIGMNLAQDLFRIFGSKFNPKNEGYYELCRILIEELP